MMNLLRLIGGRAATAPVARERLQILLAHERGLRGQPELLERLRAEILAAVSRHVVLDPEKVVVRMERGKQVSTLEVDIEVPNDLFGPSRKRRVTPDRHAPSARGFLMVALGCIAHGFPSRTRLPGNEISCAGAFPKNTKHRQSATSLGQRGGVPH
jgi:cell division topological specificity factor